MAEKRRRRGHSGDERERKCIIPSDQGILRIHTGVCRASEAVSPPVQSSTSILQQGALTTTQPCIQTHKTLLLYLQQYRATTAVHFTHYKGICINSEQLENNNWLLLHPLSAPDLFLRCTLRIKSLQLPHTYFHHATTLDKVAMVLKNSH